MMHRTHITDSFEAHDFVEVHTYDGYVYLTISESSPPSIACVSFDVNALEKLRDVLSRASEDLAGED